MKTPGIIRKIGDSLAGLLQKRPRVYKSAKALLLAGMGAGTVLAGQGAYNTLNVSPPTGDGFTPAANDAYRCRAGMPGEFANAARRVNFFGETGVSLSVGFGLDDACNPYNLPYYENWQAMLGRHEMLMKDAYRSSVYRFQLDGLKHRIEEELGEIDWQDPVARYRAVAMVNSYVTDNFDYTREKATFYKDDYTASPNEALSRGSSGRMRGDCDDYTAVKFIMLRELGFDDSQMFAAVVDANGDDGQVDHMVLMVNLRTEPGDADQFIVLDNMTGHEMRPAAETTHRAFMAFNGTGGYIFPQALRDVGIVNLTSLLEDPAAVRARQAQARNAGKNAAPA